LFAGNASVVSDELRQRLLDNKPALIEFLTPKPLESEAPPVVAEPAVEVKKWEAQEILEQLTGMTKQAFLHFNVLGIGQNDDGYFLELEPKKGTGYLCDDDVHKKLAHAIKDITGLEARVRVRRASPEVEPVAEPVGTIVPKVETVEPVEESTAFEIALYIKGIGGEDVNAVNARELWTKLEAKTKFADWIKRRIEDYGFVEGIDFICFLEKENAENNANSKQYFIGIEMAKELSMVEKNAQGKIARRYFIECEKAAKGSALKFDHLSPEVIAALKQARTVQLAMGMTKTQSSKYARDLIQDRFGFDMERATTGIKNEQLQLRIVK
jgi:phage anti-repressor protein